MRILVDLDDTLVDMMTKAVYYYNGATGEDLQLEDIKEWALSGRRPDFEKIWRIPGFFADLPFMDHEAQSVLYNLKMRGHEIVICSAIPTWESPRDKYSWCHTHLRIPGIIDSMDQVIFARNKSYIEGECMVDDKPDNLEGRRFPILFARPWNNAAYPYPRLHSWSGVFRQILNFEREDYNADWFRGSVGCG